MKLSRVRMQTIVNALAIASLPLLATACLQLREDQKEVEEKVVVRKQLSTLQQTSADTNSRFQEVDDEIRRTNGRIETVEAKLAQSQARADRGTNGVDAKIKENDQVYREEFSKLTTEIAHLKEQFVSLQTSMEEGRRANQERAKLAESKAAEASKNPLATGEELYTKKQWKDAVLSFERYRSQNPKGKSFAVATYKIGVCFQELGMNEDATAFYEEVVSKFPKSGEAAKAQARLRKIKK